MNRISRPMHNLAGALLISLSLGLVACGGPAEPVQKVGVGAPPTSGASEGPPATDSVPPSGDELDPATFGPGSLRPVVNSRNFDQRGFVRADDLFPSQPGRPIPDLVEVLDTNSAVIAYWGNRVGWIDKDTVEAPGFDFAAYRATQNHDAPPKPPSRG